MMELDSPETHIYISTRGYRECLNSACEIEVLEGTLRINIKTASNLFIPTYNSINKFYLGMFLHTHT